MSFGVSSLPAAVCEARSGPAVVLCIAPTLFSVPATLLAAWVSGARTWLHIQDFELDAALGLGMLRGGLIARVAAWFERMMLTHFDRVSTISETMLQVARAKGVAADRLVLLPNWVDTQEIRPLEGDNPLRRELGIPIGHKVILYHGSMGMKQGLGLLVEVAARLSHRLGILFLLCGEGPARAELQKQANGLLNIRFADLQPEDKLNQLVNLADVHVLPQRAGAADLVMPSKLTTMLASGKPIIACAAPGTQLWKVVGQVGVTVEPENADHLGGAIMRLLSDPAECARLGKLGRAYACEHLEKDVILGKFMHDLEELLNNKDVTDRRDEIEQASQFSPAGRDQ